MRAASYLTPEPNVTAGAGGRLGGLLETGGSRGPAGPEVRRRHADVAPERLGELRGLAVAHPRGDLTDGEGARGQQLGRPGHPHPGQVLAKGRPADFGEGPLQLAARGGQAPGDVVQGQVLRVLARDDLARLLEQARAKSDRRESLGSHLDLTTGDGPIWM